MARRGGAGGFRLLHWLALVLVLADQASKVFIIGSYALGEGTPVTEFFNLVRVHNTGAAFSFLADAGGWQRWMFAGLSAGASLVIVYLLHSHAGQRLFCFALTCVLGGAVGNLIDRVIYGYVVDFLDFYVAKWHFPAFNLADSAITLGAACLILDELMRVRRAA